VQIARVNIEVKKETDTNKSQDIEKTKEVYKIVKDFLFSQLISETEFIESLPELCSDGQDTWFHKKNDCFFIIGNK
jgi:hypothetical protein